jgi:hypothetical protein
MSPAVQLRLILPSVARLDLTDEQRDVLVRTLRQIVDSESLSAVAAYPLSAAEWLSRWTHRVQPMDRRAGQIHTAGEAKNMSLTR